MKNNNIIFKHLPSLIINKHALLLSFLFYVIYTNAQMPSFQWAKQLGDINSDEGNSIILDAKGNVYTTGRIQPSGSASSNIFVSKLGASGNLLWIKYLAGTLDGIGRSITIDGNSNLYITGKFRGTTDFDPGPATFNLISNGSEDIFFSKLDSSGNFLWARTIGGTSAEEGISITVDSTGNSYTTGYFRGTVDFDPGIGTYNLTSTFGTTGSETDIFIIKLDASGNFIWAKKIGGQGNDLSQSIKIDVLGNVYTTGNYFGTVDFDPNTGTFYLTNNSTFILKLDSLGYFIWAKSFGGSAAYNYYPIITLDKTGNIYTTGTFLGSGDFDPGNGTFYLFGAGKYDVFISKFDSSGNFIWAKSIGGPENEQGSSIVTDANCNVYIVGNFQGTADFDPGVGTFLLTAFNNNYDDIFISKLDSAGNFLWATRMGGSGYDFGLSIVVNQSGSIYTTGRFHGVVDFNPGSDTFNLTSGITYPDIFIHKMNQSSVGIFERSYSNTSHLYPNPNNGLFTLNITDIKNNSSVEIYNNLGDLVYSLSTVKDINNIDLTNQSNGLYFIKVTRDIQNFERYKIIKQ